MFRGHCNKGNSENSVYSCCECFNAEVCINNVHLEMDSFGSAYPVPLHCDNTFRPSVKIVKAVCEFLRIIRYPYKPLFQSALNNRSAAAPTDTVTYYLFVCKHCLAVFTPVDRCVLAVYKPLFIELEEKPLIPFIVIYVARLYPASPVVAVTCSLQLPGHMFNIAPCPFSRGEFHFYGCVFSRHSKSIKTHGVENIVSLHP